MYQKHLFALLCIFLALPIEGGRKGDSYFGNREDCRAGNSQRSKKQGRKKGGKRNLRRFCELREKDGHSVRKYRGRGEFLSTQASKDAFLAQCLRDKASTPPILDHPTNNDTVLFGGNGRGNKDASQLAIMAAVQKAGPVKRHGNAGQVKALQPYFQSLRKHAGNFQGYEAGR
jgi:hypothetical protein